MIISPEEEAQYELELQTALEDFQHYSERRARIPGYYKDRLTNTEKKLLAVFLEYTTAVEWVELSPEDIGTKGTKRFNQALMKLREMELLQLKTHLEDNQIVRLYSAGEKLQFVLEKLDIAGVWHIPKVEEMI